MSSVFTILLVGFLHSHLSETRAGLTVMWPLLERIEKCLAKLPYINLMKTHLTIFEISHAGGRTYMDQLGGAFLQHFVANSPKNGNGLNYRSH
jgi:hypothetical protein